MAETTFHSITLPGANPARVPLTAVEFSTSTAYKVRDYCTYQGKLYICSTAHAAGAWNAAHFTEVNVGDEINTRLVVPPTTEPASTDRRVGDLWIDTNTESPVISIDPQPVAGSTNVPQSGGTFNLIKNLDNNKAGKSLLTGDFSASSPYSVNDLCIHDGYLYRCIVDIPAGAAWNASKWQATTIETELVRIESEGVDLNVIAETFGDSSSYAVGDYVLHTTNGVDKLYKCISAVSDTSVWNSQYWSEVKLADEVSDLKSALGSVTATDNYYDVSNNLISEFLQTGYYNDSGVYTTAPNYSYTIINVEGIHKVKISGTHHVYTIAQFTAFGVVMDASGTFIANIKSIYGGTPTEEPYELELPANAKYIYLNTDYNASYYPDSFPPGLYCYPIVESLMLLTDKLNVQPVKWEDISDGKKIKIIAGVIRNSGNGWEFINDAGHRPLNLASVSISGAFIRVTYSFRASKVLSLVVTPDETFAPLYHAGASVGDTYADIGIWQTPDELGGKVVYANGAWDSSSSTFTSASFGYGRLILYHPSLANYIDAEKSNVSVTGIGCVAYIRETTDTSVVVGLKDFNGADIDTPTDGIGVCATRYINERQASARYISNPSGNFWIFGVMEIE